MNCRHCGAENDDGNRICRICKGSLRQRTSRLSVLAVTSVVLGVLSVFLGWIWGFAGCVLGFWALFRIERSCGGLTGRAFGIAGVVLSAIGAAKHLFFQ